MSKPVSLKKSKISKSKIISSFQKMNIEPRPFFIYQSQHTTQQNVKNVTKNIQNVKMIKEKNEKI